MKRSSLIARVISFRDRYVRWCINNKHLAETIFVLVLLLCIGMVASLWMKYEQGRYAGVVYPERRRNSFANVYLLFDKSRSIAGTEQETSEAHWQSTVADEKRLVDTKIFDSFGPGDAGVAYTVDPLFGQDSVVFGVAPDEQMPSVADGANLLAILDEHAHLPRGVFKSGFDHVLDEILPLWPKAEQVKRIWKQKLDGLVLSKDSGSDYRGAFWHIGQQIGAQALSQDRENWLFVVGDLMDQPAADSPARKQSPQQAPSVTGSEMYLGVHVVMIYPDLINRPSDDIVHLWKDYFTNQGATDIQAMPLTNALREQFLLPPSLMCVVKDVKPLGLWETHWPALLLLSALLLLLFWHASAVWQPQNISAISGKL